MTAYYSIRYTVPNSNGLNGADGKPRREKRTACIKVRDTEHLAKLEADYKRFLESQHYDIVFGSTVHVHGTLA